MRMLSLVLTCFAPVFLVVALLHLVFGLNADALLGAKVSPETAADPSLDSQNRFYGVAFALYGVVLYLCARDLRRYEAFFKAALGVFFCGGVARLVSWVTLGAPAPLVVVLAVSELLIPALLLLWYAQVKHEAD